MFGLELEVKTLQKKELFFFLDTIKDHKEKIKILHRIEKKIQKMKSALTRGVPQNEFLKIKILLEGYLILHRLFQERK